jgi:hypothetical protein
MNEDQLIAHIMDLKEGLGLSAGQNKIIMNNQSEMFERLRHIELKQVSGASELQEVKRIVTNGLKHKLDEACLTMSDTCKTLDTRLQRLESFGWFRTKITWLRDVVFWSIVIGAWAVVIATHGKELGQYILKHILKIAS